MLAERQVAAVLMAAGAKKVQMPDLQQQWDDLDASLLGEVDNSQDELRRALGLL